MGIIRAASMKVLGQSSVQASHTGDLLESTLATVTIPAGAMGANGTVWIYAVFSNTSNVNNKTLRVKFGGTAYAAVVSTTGNLYVIDMLIGNRNATNSQFGTQGTFLGTSASAKVTSAIDTTASVDITLTGQLAVNTDTVSLEQYQVVLYPKA